MVFSGAPCTDNLPNPGPDWYRQRAGLYKKSFESI